MRKQVQSSLSAADNQPAGEPRESPLSLSRLREAFAAMLGGQDAGSKEQGAGGGEPAPEGGSFGETALRGCEVNPRTVVESMLFVGRPDNGPMSARELAAAMRGVSPTEIEAAVEELNAAYDKDHSPYRIEQSNGGYRLGAAARV